MSNIDIDHIIKQIKKQALLHKSIDVEQYKRNLKFLTDKEEVDVVSEKSNVFKIGKKIDQRLYDNSIYQKIRPSLVKYKEIVKNERISINLGELLKYDDVQFIDVLYKRLLNREPDEADLDNCTNMLRLNKLSKVDIIKSFMASEEFAKTNRNIKIKEIRRAYVLQKIQTKCMKIPYIGYIFNIIIEIIMLPKRNREFEEFRKINSIIINENKYDIIDMIKMSKKYKDTMDSMKNELDTLQEQLDQLNSNYVTNEEKIRKNLNELKKENQLKLEKIQEKLIEVKIQVNKASLGICTEIQEEKLENAIDIDQFYVNFENKFRGDEGVISKRLDIYIDKLKKNFNSEDEIKLLDLGCGRGEWIKKLIDNGFNNVIGIDLNSKMISECKRNGLNVLYGNAIDYLKLQPDNSINFISGFHIIEHLSFEEKLQFVQQSYRVLKKQGVLLLETPNPENVLVGSCSFYTDLTHKNPVHPETLKFLMEEVGLRQAEIIRVNPLNYIDQSLVIGEMRHIAFRFNMEQDYSVWGVK